MAWCDAPVVWTALVVFASSHSSLARHILGNGFAPSIRLIRDQAVISSAIRFIGITQVARFDGAIVPSKGSMGLAWPASSNPKPSESHSSAHKRESLGKLD
jgi:hypothetical protein